MAKPQQKSQIDKFKELAREVEADEDEENFDKALRAMRVTPPAYPPSKKADQGG